MSICQSCRVRVKLNLKAGLRELSFETYGARKTAAGYSKDDVVKTTCFIADMGDFATFNEIYGAYFTSKPARSCVAVKTLPKNALAEVEVIAVK